MFHFEISGNFANDFHPENKFDIFFALLKFHLEISGNFFNDEHFQNI